MLVVKYCPSQTCAVLQLILTNKRLKPFLKLLFAELLTLPLLLHSIDTLGRDEDAANNLDYAIRSDAILDCHVREAIDPDADETSVASNVDAKGLVIK